MGLVAISASKIFKNGVIDYHEDHFEVIEKLEKKKKRYRYNFLVCVCFVVPVNPTRLCINNKTKH